MEAIGEEFCRRYLESGVWMRTSSARVLDWLSRSARGVELYAATVAGISWRSSR